MSATFLKQLWISKISAIHVFGTLLEKLPKTTEKNLQLFYNIIKKFLEWLKTS